MAKLWGNTGETCATIVSDVLGGLGDTRRPVLFQGLAQGKGKHDKLPSKPCTVLTEKSLHIQSKSNDGCDLKMRKGTKPMK